MKLTDTPLELPCHLKAVLGECRQTLPELLTIQMGSMIELDRLAGDVVDVEVNGRVLFRGEVVVLDKNFGIRVTEIVDDKTGVAHG